MKRLRAGSVRYRLTNEWADPYDKDSDQQRINPGYVIADADQRCSSIRRQALRQVDAKFAFVITAKSREAFEEEHEDAITDWDVRSVEPPTTGSRPMSSRSRNITRSRTSTRSS
jgi:hypothetical protein